MQVARGCPHVARLVQEQLAALRAAIANLLGDRADREVVAEAFVAISSGYVQQLALRGDLDPTPFSDALTAIVASRDPCAGCAGTQAAG